MNDHKSSQLLASAPTCSDDPVLPPPPPTAHPRATRAAALAGTLFTLAVLALSIATFFTLAPPTDAASWWTRCSVAMGIITAGQLAALVWAACTRNVQVYKRMQFMSVVTYWIGAFDLVMKSARWAVRAVGGRAGVEVCVWVGLLAVHVVASRACVKYEAVMEWEERWGWEEGEGEYLIEGGQV